MEQYTVTGMSCAACSARVEKAVSKVAGVSACSVSLLTNSMGVEGNAAPEDIVRAVEEAGYGAARKGGGAKSSVHTEQEELLKDRETPVLKQRLWYSAGFLALVFFNGAYDVEFSSALCAREQSCRDGADTAVTDHGSHGRQPEIFCQRI